MKTGPKLLLAGAVGVAIAILAVAWNGAFAATPAAATSCSEDMTKEAVENTWLAKAAEIGVTLQFAKELTPEQTKAIIDRTVELAGPVPYDFDEIWVVVTSGGMTNVVFWNDGCAMGKASTPTSTFTHT
jgi:hypothetical protein